MIIFGEKISTSHILIKEDMEIYFKMIYAAMCKARAAY